MMKLQYFHKIISFGSCLSLLLCLNINLNPTRNSYMPHTHDTAISAKRRQKLGPELGSGLHCQDRTCRLRASPVDGHEPWEAMPGPTNETQRVQSTRWFKAFQVTGTCWGPWPCLVHLLVLEPSWVVIIFPTVTLTWFEQAIAAKKFQFTCGHLQWTCNSLLQKSICQVSSPSSCHHQESQ